MNKDPRYFQHDSNAQHDPKIRALIKKYGVEGYGRYWIIIETLREAPGHKMEDDELNWESLAEAAHCETTEIKAFVDDCVKIFKLFAQEDGYFYSLSLIARMAHLKLLRANKQKGAYAMHDKLHHNITKDPDDSTF